MIVLLSVFFYITDGMEISIDAPNVNIEGAAYNLKYWTEARMQAAQLRLQVISNSSNLLGKLL